MNTDETTREKLRSNLYIIRIMAGWSADHFANLLGITRSTVSKLENTENKMSVIQYLAIRKLIDEEIKDNDNLPLERTMNILVDRDNVPELIKDKFREDVKRIVRDVGRKAGSETIRDVVWTEMFAKERII